MSYVSHIFDLLGHFDEKQREWFLLVLILLIVLSIGGVHGYWLYLRAKARPQREQAEVAHQGIILLTKFISEAEVHFHHSQESLLEIDKTLNTLSVVGPERVTMLLADIRMNVGKCLEELATLRRMTSIIQDEKIITRQRSD